MSVIGTQCFSLETTEGIKKDFNHFKTKVWPEKKTKIKKKISEISSDINSKIQKKTDDQ